jgi:hypothetical protein
MDALDWFLLLFTPVGVTIVTAIGVSYVLCNYVPLPGECAPLAAWVIGVGLVVGVAIGYGQLKRRNTRDGS